MQKKQPAILVSMQWKSKSFNSTKNPKENSADIFPDENIHQWLWEPSLLRLVLETGYLMALRSTLRSAAFPRSMPQISESLTRYRRTSESSSPKCCFSSSFQSGSPFGTSPLHWNISDSSPTSPTCASFHPTSSESHKMEQNPTFLLIFWSVRTVLCYGLRPFQNSFCGISKHVKRKWKETDHNGDSQAQE